MEVTEVRLRKMTSGRLLAVGSITFDGIFVVHNIRVIDTLKGKLVVMPNKAHYGDCQKCGASFSIIDAFCSQCGYNLGDPSGRLPQHRVHQDLCHPTVQALRDEINSAVLAEYERLP